MNSQYSREELEQLDYEALKKLAAELELQGAEIKKTRHLFIEQFWQRMNKRPVKAAELTEEQLAAAHIDGQPIVFARVGDKIYAFNDRCPHKGFPLHKGSLRGGVLTCAYHGGKFELRNGKCLQHPYETLPCQSFAVTVHTDGKIDCAEKVAPRR